MLGLYLYTLIIGNKSCNMLSTCILNAYILQKKYKNIVTNNVLGPKKTQKHKNNKTKNQT